MSCLMVVLDDALRAEQAAVRGWRHGGDDDEEVSTSARRWAAGGPGGGGLSAANQGFETGISGLETPS